MNVLGDIYYLKGYKIMAKSLIEFSKEAVDKIDELIDSTKERELGGLLCIDVNNKVYLESIVEGTETSLDIPLECEEGNKPIGTFHTHPLGEIERVSSSDYERATQDIITCIGQKVKGLTKIKCLIPMRLTKKEEEKRKYLIDELSEIDFLVNIGYSHEEVEEMIMKSKLREQIDKYFNFLNIP